MVGLLRAAVAALWAGRLDVQALAVVRVVAAVAQDLAAVVVQVVAVWSSRAAVAGPVVAAVVAPAVGAVAAEVVVADTAIIEHRSERSPALAGLFRDWS